MVKYKVALSKDVRGVSEHRGIKIARESKKEHGSEYHIYKWEEGSRHTGRGWWFYE
jgi:hypothetical protein